MRKKVGQQWAREIKEDADLKANYEKVGKSWALQRQFRQEWAKKKFEARKQKRFSEFINEDAESMEGEYLNAEAIAWEEHSSSASKNYVLKAIEEHKAGRKWRNKPWLQFNQWTKKWEFWYVHKKFRTGALKRWGYSQSSTSEGGVASSSGLARESAPQQLTARCPEICPQHFGALHSGVCSARHPRRLLRSPLILF